MSRLTQMASLGSLLLLSACGAEPAPVVVVSATEVGVLPSPSAIQGRDGGDSARVWGRTVFAFGDTFLNVPDLDGVQLHPNSLSYTTDATASDGIAPIEESEDAAGAPLYYVAPTADEAAFNAMHYGESCAEPPCGARYAAWAGAPIWDAAHARAIVLYTLIYAEPGDFNFHGVGASIALWSAFEEPPSRPVIDPSAAHPTLIWAEGERAPTSAGQIVGDELWAFSCESGQCGVMRCPLDHLLEHDAWRYWSGTEWSSDRAALRDVLDAPQIVTVRFNDYLGLFTAIYSVPGSNEVVLRSASDLRGPWSAPRLLFVADTHDPDYRTYDANEHPSFAEDGGRVLYVTYSRPTPLAWFSNEFALVRVEIRSE